MSTNTNFAQNRIAKEPYWVEYLESGNNIPIIDTGIPLSDIGAVHCTFSQPTNMSFSLTPKGFGTNDMFFFGGKGISSGGSSVGDEDFALYSYYGAATKAVRLTDNVGNKVYSLYCVSTKSGSSITNKIFYTKGYGLDESNTRLVNETHTASSVSLATTFALFRCKDGSSSSDGVKCKIYSCHIFDHDGNVISWLRPCLHPNTLHPAFYDLIRHRYLYNSDPNGILTYGHTFIPAHYIRMNGYVKLSILGVNSANKTTLQNVSPNPYRSRLDTAIRIKAGGLDQYGYGDAAIAYPGENSNDEIVLCGGVGSNGESVTLNIYRMDLGGNPPDAFTDGSIGKMANVIIHNNMVNNTCYFINNGITHTAPSSFLYNINSGDGVEFVATAGGIMDIGGFSMRYTTPNTAISNIQPFGFYYDLQPCRRITTGTYYGRSAFFDYVNAQYIMGYSENVTSASEGICTLTVNDTSDSPTADAVAWQYHTP